MERKKVLIVSPGLPFPPVDGHKLKLYNLCLILSKKFDLHLITISNERPSLECLDFINQNFKSKKVFIFPKIFFLINLMFQFFNFRVPFQVSLYNFKIVRKFIKANFSSVDFVLFNLVRTTSYINIFSKEKIILDLVDSIGLNYVRSKHKTASFFHRFVYLIEGERLVKYEKYIISKSKISLFVNRYEFEYFQQSGDVFYLPNGVNKNLFEIKEVNRLPIVCFFGSMSYQPNIDAVLWFIKNVLPLIDSKINFCIVGLNPSNEILRLRSERIQVTGFLENPYDLIKSSLCTVAPMQTGGGIQNKILESMALGQLTITNNLGAEPIVNHSNFNNILIANSPHEFASLINQIFENPEKFDSIRINSRDFIKKNYSWDIYEEKLINLFS